MKNRIGKCIIHNAISYDGKLNESAFTGDGAAHIVYKNPDKIYVYYKNTETDNLKIIMVIRKDCLFVYEDEFEKYAEYFI
jgi:hypothetical protein